MYSYALLLLLFTPFSVTGGNQKNNVCKGIFNYVTINSNKNCWYNPDVKSSIAEIFERYGYKFEEYEVTTEDGYILTLYRIPPKNPDAQTILLQHGLGGSAIFWMMLEQNSLAFVLSNKGFDVWLSTIRGGPTSQKHVNLTVSDPEYWNFSFHEMAIYDLPAMVEFIIRTTKTEKKIIYVGHSMGTTISRVYTDLLHEHAGHHLKGVIDLAPVINSKHMRGITPIASPFLGIIKKLLNLVGVHAIFFQTILIKVNTAVCERFPGIWICDIILVILNGYSSKEARPDLLPFFFNNFPRGISLKTLNHYGQCVRSGKIQMYDYKNQNYQKYHSNKPPVYGTDNIAVATHFFVGINDFFATKQDVEVLYRQLLSNGVSTSVHYLDYSHNDFFLGRYVDNFYEIFLKIINELQYS